MITEALSVKRLEDWLEVFDLTAMSFAGKVNVYPQTVQRWIAHPERVLLKNRRICTRALKLKQGQIDWSAKTK